MDETIKVVFVRFNTEIPATEFGSAKISIGNHDYYPHNPVQAWAAMKMLAQVLNLKLEFNNE